MGQHAPGIRDDEQAVAATHHLLLAHGRATAAVRAAVPSGAAPEVGITLNMAQVYAADPGKPADRELAADVDAEINGVFLEPLVHGSYPDRWTGITRPGRN